MASNVIKIVPELIVDDVKESIQFYAESFGFDIEFESDGFGKVRSGDVEIMFYRRKEFEEEVGISQAMDLINGVIIYLQVGNVVEVWNKIKDKVNVLVRLRNMKYGGKEFVIEDNNGYVVVVGGGDE